MQPPWLDRALEQASLSFLGAPHIAVALCSGTLPYLLSPTQIAALMLQHPDTDDAPFVKVTEGVKDMCTFACTHLPDVATALGVRHPCATQAAANLVCAGICCA